MKEQLLGTFTKINVSSRDSSYLLETTIRMTIAYSRQTWLSMITQSQ